MLSSLAIKPVFSQLQQSREKLISGLVAALELWIPPWLKGGAFADLIIEFVFWESSLSRSGSKSIIAIELMFWVPMPSRLIWSYGQVGVDIDTHITPMICYCAEFRISTTDIGVKSGIVDDFDLVFRLTLRSKINENPGFVNEFRFGSMKSGGI